jgi:hypothetical protein
VSIPRSNGRLPLDQEIVKAMRMDAFAQKILTMLNEGKQYCREISLSKCQECNAHLLYQQWLYIPVDDARRLRILQSHHDIAAAGYPR